MNLLEWLAIEEAIAAGCPSYHFGETGTSASAGPVQGELRRPARSRTPTSASSGSPITRADRALRSGVKRAIGFRDGA